MRGDAHKRTGAERICAALEGEGVQLLFGYPGGAIMPFYDAMHQSSRLRHVLVRHEQSAVHAADGYARATGRVGVCVATSGPGATNLITGLATAAMDGVPLVALTGQVATSAMGSDAFQEADILGITIPVTKHGFLLSSVDDIEAVIHDAFRLALSGRPGPVLVDIPKDVQLAVSEGGELPVPARVFRNVSGGDFRPVGAGEVLAPLTEQALSRAVELLNEAERPVLVAGRGVVQSGTAPLLCRLAERFRLPVATTLLGLDGFPRNHELALGMSGMHGTPQANRALQHADVLIGLGLRFDDRVTGPLAQFAPDAQVVLFEVDGAAVGRTIQPAVAVVGDLRDTLPALLRRVRREEPVGWWKRIKAWSSEADSRHGEDRESSAGGLLSGDPEALPTGREAARLLSEVVTQAEAQIAIDVGQHQMWMAQELRDAAPGTCMTSGGLGTMGYALPAGLGAALGKPERVTWVVVGDGGFQMSLPELATVVQEGIPLRIAVLNNSHLGMVRQWQEMFFQGRIVETRLSGPDFTMLAGAYGVPARTVSRRRELPDALRWAESQSGPVLLEIKIVCEDSVYPIVPPGAALHQLLEAGRSEPRLQEAEKGS